MNLMKLMNLGKLLSAGRSIFAGDRKQYQVDKRFHLPDFNGQQNRYAAKPPAIVVLPDDPAARTRMLTSLKPSEEVVVPSAPVTAWTSQAAKSAKSAKPDRKGWSTRLNPFRAKPAPAPALTTPVTQSEFSLNAVKVVHNDLTDADVEVVPVSTRASKPAKAPQLPSGRRALEFLDQTLGKSK